VTRIAFPLGIGVVVGSDGVVDVGEMGMSVGETNVGACVMIAGVSVRVGLGPHPFKERERIITRKDNKAAFIIYLHP
jgi:hypothetical protein